MQITLNETEIFVAISEYVRTKVKIAEGMDVTITDMKAGRGEHGFTATLDIVPTGSVPVKQLPVEENPTVLEKMKAPAKLKTTKPVDVTEEVVETAKTPSISTGEERVDPEVEEEVIETTDKAPVATTANPFAGRDNNPEGEPTEVIEEDDQPVETKPEEPKGSIFNFNKA